MRRAVIERKTQETAIRAVLNIDGRGQYRVSTGIRFFDHMLELFARHGGFDLELRAQGDLDVDQHHTVEDVGIVLGEAFHKALGSKRGVLRAGYFVMPMDETLGLAAVDFGGRASSVVDTKVRQRLVGDLQAELVYDFFEGFSRGARANVHARVLYGRSSHHKIESLFKAFSRALRAAWRLLREKEPARFSYVIVAEMRRYAAAGRNVVIACSALKEAYRDRLASSGPVRFVYLKGDAETITPRLAGRRGHFMPPSLLASQFATLEEPDDAIVVDIREPVAAQVAAITRALREQLHA